MGTHPIFESDFDCLTDIDNKEMKLTKASLILCPIVTSDRCLAPMFQVGRCKALFYRYAYNVYTENCERRIYGGCGDWDNMFDTEDECISHCSHLSFSQQQMWLDK